MWQVCGEIFKMCGRAGEGGRVEAVRPWRGNRWLNTTGMARLRLARDARDGLYQQLSYSLRTHSAFAAFRIAMAAGTVDG